jgi:hypothetical protein
LQRLEQAKENVTAAAAQTWALQPSCALSVRLVAWW